MREGDLTPQGAVLVAEVPVQRSPVRRAPPAPGLRDRVRHYWTVAWDIPPGQVQTQPVLTLPIVNLSFEAGRVWVSGPVTRRTDVALQGTDFVVGVAFQPAGFGALLGVPLADLTDQKVPVEVTRWPGTANLATQLAAGTWDWEAEAVPALDAWLQGLLPPATPIQRQINAWVEVASQNRGLVRADVLAGRVGVSPRTLQRHLRTWAGVGPKWLLRRARLHDAAHALEMAPGQDMAALAHSLGYFDQAHFSRDFREEIGVPPGQYATRCARREGVR